MKIDRLKSKIWVQFQVRLCTPEHRGIYVIKKGNPDAGEIIVRINKLHDTNTIYRQVRINSDKIGWMPSQDKSTLSDKEADLYLEKQQSIDPDLWILEIEDGDNSFEFNEPVLY